MTEEKKRQLAMNLAWLCRRDSEDEDCCPCLPQNGCPQDIEGKNCPATREDWLEWMEVEEDDDGQYED